MAAFEHCNGINLGLYQRILLLSASVMEVMQISRDENKKSILPLRLLFFCKRSAPVFRKFLTNISDLSRLKVECSISIGGNRI